MPACAIFALLMCGADWALPALALTAYVLLETNNESQLLRIPSRMVTAMWLLLTGIIPFMHHWGACVFCALCMAVAHRLLFRCYERSHPVTDVFHSFLLVGLCSMVLPHMLLFVPFHLFYITVFLRSMSLRVLCASLIGLMLPFWCLLGWCAVMDDYAYFSLWAEGIYPLLPDADVYLSFPLYHRCLWAFVTLTGGVAVMHQIIYNYSDKIRTRMFLYILVGDTLLSWLLLTAQPHLYMPLTGVLTVSVAPVMAHYYAQTHSVGSNLFTILTLILFSSLVWMLSQI